MLEIVLLLAIGLCVGAYAGYTYAVRSRFPKIKLQKLAGLYDNLNQIIGMRDRLAFPETLPDPFDRSIADAMASVIDPKGSACRLCSDLKEPKRTFAGLCKKTFRDSDLLEDKMFLPDHIRKALDVERKSLFIHQSAAHDCDFLNISRKTSKDFFERCMVLRNKIEERIDKLQRWPF